MSVPIIAPFSKHGRNSLMAWTLILAGAGLWTTYDGYYNSAFIQEHTLEDGSPDSDLLFNRYAPPFCFITSLFLGITLALKLKMRLVADGSALVIHDKKSIPYDDIEQIDKTYFESKGYFDVEYRCRSGMKKMRLSDRMYDNLASVLDHLVLKMTEEA